MRRRRLALTPVASTEPRNGSEGMGGTSTARKSIVKITTDRAVITLQEELPICPYVPTVRDLDLSSPQGVNPGGLFVRWRRSGAKNAMVILA
jgi:hypothetical protein